MGNRNYSLAIVNKRQGNVMVKKAPTKNGEYILIVELHGHEVFKADYDKRIFSIDMCGYYTTSTRDVINTALREIRPDVHVFKSKNIWRMSFDNGSEESQLETCERKKYGF